MGERVCEERSREQELPIKRERERERERQGGPVIKSAKERKNREKG